MKTKKSRGGRPTQFTPTVALELGLAMGRGQKFEAAAKTAGIGASTAYRWLAAARAGDPRYVALVTVLKKPPPSPFNAILKDFLKRRSASSFGICKSI
jgi:hypothetical protein